jgi:hypothetical protein
VHQLEKSYVAANLGDWISSPYYYFTEYFSRYTCVLHAVWTILWHEIEKDDVVIFGGGGLLDYSDPLNIVLNRLLEKCDNVIIWGPGTHKFAKNNVFGQESSTIPINFEKAVLCGVRDYQHPYNLPFLPCASCLHPAFSIEKTEVKIEREIGTIMHGLDGSFRVAGVPSSVNNANPIGTIVNYILSSNVMLVSSYHGAYWSMLLGRKVILEASRLDIEKYKYFRYPVDSYQGKQFDERELLRIASEIPDHSDFLAEARALNNQFFEKVKILIEDRIPRISTTETIQVLSKRVAQLEFTIFNMWINSEKINRRIDALESNANQ